MAFNKKIAMTWCMVRSLRTPLLSNQIQINKLANCRHIFSVCGEWDKEWNEKVNREIEAYWKPRIKEYDLTNVSRLPSEIQKEHTNKEKFYVLSMFPYPSGNLHMGHVRVYTISDVMARFNRLRGKEVIHPMGWDAFGLPAENAAIDRGEIPDEWTKKNIESMRKQLEDLGCSFDWNRELATCDPEYYKWTQYIFLKMYEAGLVYRKKAKVNWDPVDQTVLADEQISEDGLSWRSGAKIEKRSLEQWYIKTTQYSKSLLDGLNDVDPDLWRDIIYQQRNWIGELAYPVNFKILVHVDDIREDDILTCLISKLEYIYGISHIVLSVNHPFYTKYPSNNTHQAGLQSSNISAIHPITNESIPIYFTTDTDGVTSHNSRIARPCLNERDQEEADGLGIEWFNVLDDNKQLINSQECTGSTREEAFHTVLDKLKIKNIVSEPVSIGLTDWLISRQRFWGTPIPIIHCPKCQYVPVDVEDLPVKLPKSIGVSNKGYSTLGHIAEWVNVKCPRCGEKAKRETDTMDTFVDSSWYYLRYLDVKNQALPVDKHIADKYMPVDLYIGGKEHAVCHLFFARFFNHFLNDIGMIKHREPFVDLLTQGMVMGQSYKVKATGQYIRPEEANVEGKLAIEKSTGEALEVQWEKMSKSKYNGVNPQKVIREYGIDLTRLCILYNVAPISNRHWSNREFTGIIKWQYRIWSMITDYMIYSKQQAQCTKEEKTKWQLELSQARNFAVNEASFHLRKSYLLNTALTRLQGFTSLLKKCPLSVLGHCEEFEKSLAELVIMMSPFIPMMASEYWAGLSSTVKYTHNIYHWDKCVLDQSWPIVDTNYQYDLMIKCNNKSWGQVKLPQGILNDLTKEQALNIALTDLKFSNYVKTIQIKNVSLQIRTDYKANIHLQISDIDLKKKMKEKKSDLQSSSS